MAAIVKRSHGDDEVYEAVTNNLAAGVLVIPSTAAVTNIGKQGIVVAVDAAQNVLGVAATSCVTGANQAAQNVYTGADGYPGVYTDGPDATTVVYAHGIMLVTYTAAAVAYGTRLCAAANGAVRAWVSGTDSAASIVGWCAAVGGVTSAGGVALARINV